MCWLLLVLCIINWFRDWPKSHIFWSQTDFRTGCAISHSSSSEWVSIAPHPCQHCVVSDMEFSRYWVCGCGSSLFQWAFSGWHMMWSIFFLHTYSFGEICQGFCPFFNRVVCFPIVEIWFLSGTSFANIVPESVLWLVILLTVSFSEQKFPILMKSTLSILSFMGHAFNVTSKRSLLKTRSSRFSSCYLVGFL